MDKGSLFSSFSLVAVYIYLYIGFYTFNQNRKSNIHRAFLSLCTSYAIWSFAYAFAYISNNKYIFSFWNKISAIGWCSFSSISLYLVLLITENRKELSIMMLDIDKFKKVNDSYGHQFGDYVLKTVSNILLNTISSKGYVGRFGGEEFIIILPEIEVNCAYIMGEKIRNKIEKYKFKNDYKLTINIGIKQHGNESYIELIKITDDLLYKAKQNGRNRIEYS